MEGECPIHVENVTDDWKNFTEKTSNRVFEFAVQWITLDGPYQAVASSFLGKYPADQYIHEKNDSEQEYKYQCLPEGTGCHFKCYQRFTDKGRLSSGKKRTQKRKAVESSAERKRLCRSKTNISKVLVNAQLFAEVCVICRRIKYKKNKVTGLSLPEPLVTCQSNSAADAIQKKAAENEDEQLQLLIKDEDLVARQCQYHGSCYRAYLYDYEPVVRAVDLAYEKFQQDIIEECIINGGQILPIAKLNTMFSEICAENGVPERTLTNQSLKRKLKKSHPELLFLRVTNISWSELVLSPSSCYLTMYEDDCNEDEWHDEPMDIQHQQPTAEAVKRENYHAGRHMNQAISKVSDVEIPWPPPAAELTVDLARKLVPSDLFNHLCNVCGISDEVPLDGTYLTVPEDKEKKILSICQDIIYLYHNGRILMPKHLSVGETTRHLTGSAELVTLLNGLGHCVSNATVLDYESALAQIHVENDDEVPTDAEEIFSTLVYDNNDFGEETLSGRGTTHCTNGIMIQKRSNTSQNHGLQYRILNKPHGKRFTIPTQELRKCPGVKKKGPSSLFTFTELALDAIVAQPAMADKVYILSKSCRDGATLPGWTGFNTLLDKQELTQSVIRYLQVIDGSPTRMEVIDAVIRKSITIADRLKQKGLVLVFDQAMYSKVQQLRWLDPILEQRLVVRMGEFHTAMTFMAVICKRFQDAGLRDILLESGIVAEGSINGVLSGHHYNRCLRTLKLVYEGMSRMLLDTYIESLPLIDQEVIKGKCKALSTSFSADTMTFENMGNGLEEIISELDKFIESRSAESPTFHFWISFLY